MSNSPLQLLSSAGLSPTALLKALRTEAETRLAENRLATYCPYTRQREFHDHGARYRERLFMAGNQLGKTLAGGMECAMHLTGRYPGWWKGHRFDKPVVMWASGVTGEALRDGAERMLMGRDGKRGTGTIPKSCIVSSTASRRAASAIDTATVQHLAGGVSHLVFKSYDQGREKWQADTVDFVWFDEEPPEDIYTEGLTRTNASGGKVAVTFTPLLGMSDVVKRFLMEKSDDRTVTQMTIEDAEHYTPEQRKRIIDSYPEHEREARTKGIPILGSGRVFPVAESLLQEEAFEIPKHWPRIAGMDIGWDHPTAVVWLAWDRDADVIHVYDCYRLREQTPVVHAAAIKPRGQWIPCAWPHDALQKDKGSGEQIAKQYRDQGVNMLPPRATFEDGSNGVEAGVLDMLDRMKTGRWKVAKHLNDWWEEFRLYHRKDGLIVKEGDDLMSASRYGLMMKRHAIVQPSGQAIKLPSSSRGGWEGA